MTRPSDPQLPAPDADEPELEAYAARLRAADEARLAPLLAQARADAFAVARGIEAEVAAEERTAGGRRPERRWRLMPRLLAASVAAHAVALFLLATWARHDGAEGPDGAEAPMAARIQSDQEQELPVNDMLEVAEWLTDRAATPEGLAEVPTSITGGGLGIARREDDLGGAQDEDLAAVLQVIGPRARTAVAEHPPAVAIPMLVRRLDGLRQARLDRLGWDAAATSRRVQRTLAWLRVSQDEDGGLAADASAHASSAAVTALGMLPFLAEGRHSLASGAQAADGAWLARAADHVRRSLIVSDRGGLHVRPDAPRDALAPAALALAEDYMLAYGQLGVGEVRRRTAEIRTLLDAVPADDGRDAGPWHVWAADAAARAGIRPLRAGEVGFPRWAAGVASPLPAASTGLTALEGITAGVWRRLAGDRTDVPHPPAAAPVPDQPLARILDVLAWQAAYRTY
ncbi:MAG: hypothetical protein R3F05_00075 [Planctomycetota bacterium]|nr:hypothetical protein [Planctomycetota bacterium]MCB9825528.1 hypothetical protein [Planctomycetota bacterium]MCB9900622.1 hypothetical protein [Planctomycetota bacterium]